MILGRSWKEIQRKENTAKINEETMNFLTPHCHAFLKLVLLATLLKPNASFSMGSSARHLFLLSSDSISRFSVCKRRDRALTTSSVMRMARPHDDEGSVHRDDSNCLENDKVLASAYSVAKIASALAWISTSYIALSFHPDPKFKDCTLRHNILTMSQAYAFPLPVLWACFEALRVGAKTGKSESTITRHLTLAVSVASFWLAASMSFPSRFAFGYDLYGRSHKVATTIVHAISGLLTMGVLLRSRTLNQIFRDLVDSLWKMGPRKVHPATNSFAKNSSLLATASVGLLWFALAPIVSPYPLATVPTILGKRLSRPASAFTLMGSMMAYSLKEITEQAPSNDKVENHDDIKRLLRRGLAIGSGSHLVLIALKLIGVDGGGFIFPGRGLWEVYPAMISVPFTTGMSLLVYAILFLATCS